MARLGPIGLNQLLTDIKNWVNSKLSTKSDTAHTHTAYAVKHTYTTAANAAKNWYRIANANTKQVYTGNPIHAEFILTAYNSSYDPGYSERWYVRAMVLGRNAYVVIFGGNTAPFSQCRVLYENTLADIDDNDRPAIDIYLNYVLANGTTKIEIEEVYNQGWTFVADGQLAVSTVPTGFENVAIGVRGNGVERSTYSDIATYLNKPRRDITSNVTLADNTTYRSTTLNCTGTRTITLPSINSNYFWCVIKNFNAEADIITIHPSTAAVLIDGSNDDIILRPGEFVAIHSRAANSFTIVGDNRKRTCLVGRSGEVGTDTKHWFRVAQKTLDTRYRDAFILLDVFQAGSDSNYMGRLCAHVRVDGTIGVVGNKQFTWLYRGTQLSDADFAMTTIETSGTSVVVDIWCKRTGGYSSFSFVVVSEGFSTDSLDSPAGKWILTRARATVGDLETLDTGFTTVTNPTVVTLANSITGNAGSATVAQQVRKDPAAGSTADLLYSQCAGTDIFRLQVGGASNAGYVEIATADDGSEPIYVRQYKGTFTSLQRTATLLDGSGNTSFPGQVTGNKFDGPLTWSGTAFSYTAGNSLYFYSGQPAIANCFEGSSNDFTKFSYPTGGTAVSTNNANIQTLRFDWGNTYWHDLFMSPNNNYLWHRNVVNSDARGWRRIVEENVTGLADQSWNINIAGTAANVTGTVDIANGGTGATTRLNAVKALTNEAVGTPTHFLAITTNWGKAGYTTVAQAKTVLGITGDIISHSDSEYVHMSGDETVAGVKTFSNNTYITSLNFTSEVESQSSSSSAVFPIVTTVTYADQSPSQTARLNFRITANGDKSLYPHENNQYSFGVTSRRWATLYGYLANLGGTYLGNEASPNERTNLYLLANRDADGQSGAYIGRFRQNRTQGAMESSDVSFISFDFLENSTRYTRCFTMGMTDWDNDKVPQTYYLTSPDGKGSLGTATTAWNKVYANSYYLGTTSFTDKFVTTDTAQTISGVKTFNSDTLVSNQGNAYRIANSAGTGYGVFQRTDGSNWYMLVTANNDPLGTWTSARPISIALSTGTCNINGNAGTATQFSANTTVALTGDATGTSAGSKKGWSVPVTLANSGVTAGSYGPSADASPAHSGTFSVPSITVDAKGRITAASTKTITLPSDSNTDTLMTQNVSTTDSTYPILLCATANASSNQGAKTGIFGSGVKVNPKTSVVSAKGFSGVPTGNTYVTAVKDGGALVNSQATSWGAIWRAPTKDYQVAGATWSNNNNNVYICYSVTNANAEAGTNTMAKSLIWAADTGTLTTTTFSGALSGNASSATEFSANKDVTLTGDVTGTASSKAGWSVATTLANSGVTAGTYGPSADVTGNNNATISVPEITVDAKGRVTSVTNRTLTCKNNTYNVYNKTLTIQKNGTNVATFTSNSNTDVTANITVPTKVSELTNDSGYLTSHQSLANYLTKTTNVSEMGRYIDLHYDNATAKYDWDVRLYADSQGTAAGGGSFKIDAASAYAPAPASDANDTRIATTAWVNSKGYLTSHQSLSNYVTLNTAQEITNTKTFKDANTVVKRTDIEAGNTLPSADKLARNIFQDKNGKELGSIYYYKNTSGNTGLCLRAGDWFSESEGVYSLNASGTNRRAELVLYTNSSGDCCIQPNGYFSSTLKALSTSVWLGESTKPFGRVYANAFEFCNAGLLADTDVQTTEEHSVGFFGQNNTPLSYITFQKRPNLKDRIAVRVQTSASSYKSYDFDATCFYPESSNSVDIGSTTNIFKNIYCNNYYKGTTAFGDIVTHNASEFLTSHQSLSSCVKNVVTNSQTIKSTGITRGTAPSSTQTFGIPFTDNNGVYIGNIYGQYATDKATSVGLFAYKGTTTSNSDNAGIQIGYDASGNVYTSAPTPSSLDNSTKIATTAFVYNTAVKHLAAYTYIYVAMSATGNGSGSNTSNYMSLTDLRTYLATVHMHSSASNLNGSYSLQILFKAGDSFGDATFDATKMPGVRNLILNTSTGTNSTVNNYSTNSPTFGNINVTGDIVVTMRNLNCTGRISSQHGAYVSIDTYMGISSLMAANYGYLNVAKNMVINVCDAHVDYLFSAVNNGILAMWPGATITINFRQQCYYTRSLFYASSNGTAWIGYSSFKLTGTEPMAVWGGSGTLTGTSETAAATVEKAVTLASGQTFTLTTNATAKVKFTVDNTAANPTLNIGGTGAKPIYWNNAPVQATMLMKNITYDVKYNGSQFVIQNAVKRLTNNDFGVFRSSGNYNQTYNSGSWNFTGWALYYGTGIENSNWRGSHIGNIQQNVSTVNNTFPVLICGTANATANTLIAPYFAKGVKINPSTNVVSASGFDGPLTGDVTGNCSGTSANVTGTVAIANGGTGATTRLNAVKALTNEAVGTPTHFLAITTNWGKAGYTTVAQAKTVLGITGDIVSHNASEFLTSHQSLDNYVTLNSNQTITAIKTITGGNQGKMVFKNPDYNKGDANESGVIVSRLYFGNGASYDGANAVLSTSVDSSGNSVVELCAINNTANNSSRASLILTYDKSATSHRLLKSWGNFVPYSSDDYTLGNSSSIWKECYCNAYYLGTTAFGDIVTHNASEFLTSHQSLSSCVKNVVTNSQIIKSTGITRGTAPSSAQTFGIGFSDNNNKYIGNIYGQYATDKATYVGLYAYKGTTTSNGDNASVRVGYDASGNAYTYAPTPATTDNSTQIATTAFVKAQGYLTSHQSLANYVTTNTDQSISGIKSHSKHISILGDYVGNESSTNGRSCLYLKANRDTDGKSGLYVTKFRQNVAQGSMGNSDVVFLSHDILENETRTNAGFVESYSNWTNDVPGGMSVYSSIATRNLGTSAKPWTNAYITNLNLNGAAFDPTSINGVGTIKLLAYGAGTTEYTLNAGTTKAGSQLGEVWASHYSGSSSIWWQFSMLKTQSGTWKLLHHISVSGGYTDLTLIGLWVRIS